MTTVTPAVKTKWQKFYSKLGFWKYYFYDKNLDRKAMVYWCCFPFFFIRKFDLFSYKTKKQY